MKRGDRIRAGRWSIALMAAPCLAGGSFDADAQEPPVWTVLPAPELRIGVVSGDDAYLFQSIEAGRFLSDGRIVVADGGQLVIRVYGSDGELQWEAGGRGQGPGEFQSIQGMWITSAERIAVWDAETRRITTLGSNGDLEGTRRLRVDDQMLPGNLEVFLGSFSNDDAVLASLSFASRPGDRRVLPDRWVLGRFGLDGEQRALLGELQGMRRIGGYPVPFSPMPHTTVYRDSLYVTDDHRAEISVRDGRGLPVRTIEVPPVAALPDDAWSSLEEELRRRQSHLHLEYLEHVPRDETIPEIGGLLADDRGYIWAKVYEPSLDAIWLKDNAVWPAPGGEWRVIRPDGNLVASVRMPESVRPLEIRGDRLLGVATDALDVERIVVHTIER